ncbi:MFS transporter [Agrococcus sp. SGAir0287]|uniref:MFS transporter n=1 Tax=Agrococcus sp. SGAir0287 TaxID=2070347 RepID=UPI0010CD4C2D|nr:MFS transporter [Agrococcus sp. SGAir0287]QCR20199.1 MFS transporter [Agrococcus sp. SGAir0287]
MPHGDAHDPSAPAAPTAQTAPGAHRLEVDDVIVVPTSRVRKAISGTVVGNFMEWFDFGIYGYLAVTLAVVFTADLPEPWGLLVTLLGFAISFLVRPLGGLVLGPLGDRIGRQKVLFLTMAMMATATALIGLLPTSAQIGLWAIVPLYLLKMVQGFSTGGEYAGASTYVTEFSPDRSRGFWASWLDVGSYVGFAAGASVVALTTVVTEWLAGPGAMVDFGWRIPFLMAVPLGAVAIWFRLRIPETPAFEAVHAEGAERPDDPMARHGILGTIRHHWKAMLVVVALAAATNTVGYALTSYMPTYLERELGVHSLTAAIATVPVLLALSALLPVIGRISDRVGRKPVYVTAVVSTLVAMVPAFAIMQLGTFWAVMVALCIVAVPAALFIAVSASALPAMFPTASRFGAMAIAFNVSVSLFGGTTPLFAQALIEVTGNPYMPAFYIMLFAALGGIALLSMRESSSRPLVGSVPTVETREEAVEVVERQDADPRIDLSSMPLDLLHSDDDGARRDDDRELSRT